MAGHGKAVVFATGMHTEFGGIAHRTQTGGEAELPLRRQIAHLSRLIVLLAVFIGGLFFTIGWAIGIPIWEDFIFAVGIIIAMVPEGLLPTLTLALVLAAQRVAKRKVLVRHLPAIEALGATTVICTDKTGTPTQNRMCVQAVSFGAGDIVLSPDTLDERAAEGFRPFFLALALCHDLTAGLRHGNHAWLGDPMEVALVELPQRVLPELPAWPRMGEVPFDADRMRL